MKQTFFTKGVLALVLIFSFLGLHGQPSPDPNAALGPYRPSELIVVYKQVLTELDKQDIRDYYHITNYQSITDVLEIWYEIPFPFVVLDMDDQPIIISNESDLLRHIDNNNNGGSGTAAQTPPPPPRGGGVNGGMYNYILSNPFVDGDLATAPIDPLSVACAAYDEHVYGTNGTHTNNLPTVVIMDQLMMLSTPDVQVDLLLNPASFPAGIATHGDQVGFVINQINTINDLDPEVINLSIFDENGEAGLTDFLRAIDWLQDNNYKDLIINMSASAQLSEIGLKAQLFMSLINDLLQEMDAIMVTSAGNSNLLPFEVGVLPGGAMMSREITVTGTSNCFTKRWEGGNLNNQRFEIAAEAKDIIVPVNAQDFALADGTSFSTAQVSAVLVQLASHLPFFDGETIKNHLLSTAEQVPALWNASEQGRVLNATKSTAEFSYNFSFRGESTPSVPTTGETSGNIRGEVLFQLAPNPTKDQLIIKASATTGDSQVSLYNEMGQLLGQQQLDDIQGGQSLSLQELNATQSGVYWLRITYGDQVVVKKVIRQ